MLVATDVVKVEKKKIVVTKSIETTHVRMAEWGPD